MALTPQEKTIQKADFIIAALKLGGTLKEVEQAYKKLTKVRTIKLAA